MIAAPLLVSTLVAPLGLTAADGLHFTDVTADTGVSLTTQSGVDPHQYILEVNGGGLALIDYDNDGDHDLFIANGATIDDTEAGPGSRLYENTGGLRFRDVTSAAGIDVTRWAMGAAVADYDADGDEDLFIACFGPNILLRNDDGVFTDVSDDAGITDDRWATGSAFGDVDGDGDLDLYVVNYLVFDPENPPGSSTYKGMDVLAGPHGLTQDVDVLYENLGDGTFRDISESSGIRAVPASFGLGVIIADLTGDGKQEIYVGNDSEANFLFVRQDDGTFKDEGLYRGASSNNDGSNQATMGIALADLDGNGRPDIFTTNFSSDTNTLHLNTGRFFDDGTLRYGLGMVSRPYLGWACGFYDFDHDADEDLFVANGHVYPQATRDTMDSDYAQPTLLFEMKDGRFERVRSGVGDWLDEPRRARAAVFDDLDDDGDIDVVTAGINEPVRILRNDTTAGRWLMVELRDDRPESLNRRGLGAMIEFTRGDTSQRRWIYSGGGFQSASPPVAHFGLPVEGPTVGAMTITWPDGVTQQVVDVPLNRRLTVQRSGPLAAAPAVAPPPGPGDERPAARTRVAEQAAETTKGLTDEQRAVSRGMGWFTWIAGFIVGGVIIAVVGLAVLKRPEAPPR